VPNVDLNGAIAAALNGNIISFPTDTVPALATLPAHAAAIFEAKQRSQSKPLILMAGDIADLWQFTTGSDRELAIWQAVAARYLPGALTLVLPAADSIPAVMNPLGTNTIGLRVPDCEIARTILRQTGALATTSANLSGLPPLLTMAAIGASFPQVFTLNLDVIPTPSTPSTVIQWYDSGWKLLRQGAIEFADLD
jgi:L-threonylcarbamoyladenylate synthase